MSAQEIIIKSPLSAAREIKFYPSQMVIRVIDDAGMNKIDLGYASSRLLELLISKVGMVVEREEILQYAWNGRVVSQNNLNQSIKFVREALEDEISKDVIQTVPRRGYMFNPAYLMGDGVLELAASGGDMTVPVPALVLPPALPPSAMPPASPAGVRDYFSRWKEVLLGVFCLSQLFLLNAQIDYELLFSRGQGVQEEIVDGNRFIYVGDGKNTTPDLKDKFATLGAKFSGMSVQGGVVVFSKMHEFYEVSCLSPEGKAGALYVHASRVDLVAEQEFAACLR